jgi:acetyltransferase (GNAT) family protein
VVTKELRAYAETPDRYSVVAADGSVQRFADERVCIIEGPNWAAISGVDVDEDGVGSLLADVRARVDAEKYAIWWIGPSARPHDVYERLRALGLDDPRDEVSLLHALCLTREPAARGDFEISRIDTFEQFLAARELQWDAFETPEDRRDQYRARLREDFDDSQRVEIPVGFLATIDGRAAGTALAVPADRGVFLIGGSTAKWARGRGVYRALVHARWEYAVARGTPALVTHANPKTSYPILRRLGFEEVCTIRRLQDFG